MIRQQVLGERHPDTVRLHQILSIAEEAIALLEHASSGKLVNRGWFA